MQANSRRQSEDSAEDGSEDWDVVGSDQEDADTAHASHIALSPMPGAAAYRMSASGRVGSSSTRHLSSAGGGMSYDELASMDRAPRFITGEPQYTYGDGGGPPPADCKFYIAVTLNRDDIMEVRIPVSQRGPCATTISPTPQFGACRASDCAVQGDVQCMQKCVTVCLLWCRTAQEEKTLQSRRQRNRRARLTRTMTVTQSLTQSLIATRAKTATPPRPLHECSCPLQCKIGPAGGLRHT
jgi:hypothetical protein